MAAAWNGDKIVRISFTAPFYMATKTRSTPIWKCRRQVTMCVDANLRNEPNQHHNQTITPILTFHDYQVTAILKPQVVFSFSFRVNVPVKQYDMTNAHCNKWNLKLCTKWGKILIESYILIIFKEKKKLFLTKINNKKVYVVT